jgi:hypothetical protein
MEFVQEVNAPVVVSIRLVSVCALTLANHTIDPGEGIKVVLFRVHLHLHLRGARYVTDADRILYEPFVDSFSRVGHEYTALEVCLCEDIG